LMRIAGPHSGGMPTLLHDHPLTPERKAMLEAEDRAPTGEALLDDGEWRDLQRICDR
jgi:hypothetical protein